MGAQSWKEERLSLVIALNGDLAGGKTTVGKLLAAYFSVDLVTMGTVQRQIAAERGITTLELNRLSEVDPKIDQLIDGTVVELGESGRSLVMDSRLSWHFIPRAFKVHLIVDPAVAAERATARQVGGEESYLSTAEAAQKLAARRHSERERFLTKYGVDLDDLRNYDAVVDSTSAAPEEVVGAIIASIRADEAGQEQVQHEQEFLKPYLYLDPRRLIPLEPVLGTDPQDSITHACDASVDSENVTPVEVGRNGHGFYIVQGHNLVSAAVRDGHTLIACRLVR